MGPGRRHTLGSKGVRKAQRDRFEKLALVVAAVIIIILLLAWLSGYKQIRIAQVEVAGMDTIQSVDIIRDVKEELAGKVFALYPRNNFFLVRSGEIEGVLYEKHPKLKEVDVSREGFTKLSVQVVEREPIAKWCSEGVCHHLDETGLVYGPALPVDEEILNLYGQSSSTAPYFGATSTSGAITYPLQFLPAKKMQELEAFILELEENLIAVASLTVSPSLHYDLALSKGGYISFYPDHDLTMLAKDLVIAYHKKISSEQKQASLEYIDARFSNKVIFKFEGQPEE